MKRFALVVALLGCNKKSESNETKIELAQILVKKLALEAYPGWSMAHPEKQCPASLDELGEYMNQQPPYVDPWKRPLKMFCGPGSPIGLRGLGAMSLGPDGNENTADDIKSW